MSEKEAEVEATTEEVAEGSAAPVPTIQAKVVLYCGVCGLPAEYCEFGPDFNRCKPWLIEHCPELYPELVKKEEGGEAAEAEEEGEKKKQKRGGKGMPKAEGKGPKKGAKDPELLLSTSQKKGRKIVTTISGLKAFGVNPKDAASVFKKKFASGASVTKDGDVDIQGDLKDEVIELIQEHEEWKIPEEAIFFVEGQKKRRAID